MLTANVAWTAIYPRLSNVMYPAKPAGYSGHWFLLKIACRLGLRSVRCSKAQVWNFRRTRQAST